MTSLDKNQALEEVLDELFFSVDDLTPDAVLRACEQYPAFRYEILEFAAQWAAVRAAPEPDTDYGAFSVSEESVSLVQSFVLNQLNKVDTVAIAQRDIDAAKAAVSRLAGAELRRASAVLGFGESTELLTKLLTKRLLDVPPQVFDALSEHLGVIADALRRALGIDLARSIRYRALARPNSPSYETWEAAVRSLKTDEEHKRRLLTYEREDRAA